LTAGMFTCTVGLPIAFLVWLLWAKVNPLFLDQWFLASQAMAIYVATCWGVAVLSIGTWICRRWQGVAPLPLYRDRRRRIDASPNEHHRVAYLLGNESLALDIVERAVEMPQLPASLEGLVVVHLSDLHFTGRVGKSYFRQVVRLSNELSPDLLLITGDLVDNVRCLDWIPEILGPLEARCGKFVVLGNHDKKVGVDLVRRAVHESGLVDLGGRWMEVAVRDQRVVLAGNELPWISPAADLTGAPPVFPNGPLRIALAHTPDQISWARANHIDLLLAGHTHGGQICVPWIGPILTPSRWGIRFSWGMFHIPPTILHVTRGVSGVYPVRMNCPPELVKLVLRESSRQ